MVRAKFAVSAIELFEYPKGAGRVKIYPVFKSRPNASGNACEENHIFGDATPCGEISMHIHNPDALKQFEVGKTYYVDFSEAPE